MLFSQRKGLTDVRIAIQKESMDDALRYGLWDAFYVNLWEKLKYNGHGSTLRNTNLWFLFQRYWHIYFKRPLDNLPTLFDDAHDVIRKYFFKCLWFEVYDFIEFTAESVQEEMAEPFVNFCNYVLEREMSAYRLVDKKVVEITSEEEIASIEDALNNTNQFNGIHAHLKAALAMLADRKAPDFRNSIKESISAVEAIAQQLTGDTKTTLGAALRVLEQKSAIHPALKISLSSLYGYTSDEQGIRHAMLEEPNLSFDDAKFILVACTAFVNYLVGKAASSGIKIS